MGFVVRSRHQEMAELERMSLYQVNRELKRGHKQSLNCLSKVVNNQRVVISKKEEIEEMVVSFFSSLFQGHHRSDGSIANSPFVPVFDKLDDYLKNVGKLNDSERNNMVTQVTLEEVEGAIKDAKLNKSPGLDGLPYEFYIAVWDIIGEEFKDIIQCQRSYNRHYQF